MALLGKSQSVSLQTPSVTLLRLAGNVISGATTATCQKTRVMPLAHLAAPSDEMLDTVLLTVCRDCCRELCSFCCQ